MDNIKYNSLMLNKLLYAFSVNFDYIELITVTLLNL